jgi:hypothetical protein
MPDFTIEVQAVGGASPPEIATTSQAVEISVSPAVVFEGGAGGGDKNYYHVQAVPSTAWTIPHGLGKRPSAAVIDTGLNRVFGDEEYPDLNTMVIRFSVPFSGTATLN